MENRDYKDLISFACSCNDYELANLVISEHKDKNMESVHVLCSIFDGSNGTYNLLENIPADIANKIVKYEVPQLQKIRTLERRERLQKLKLIPEFDTVLISYLLQDDFDIDYKGLSLGVDESKFKFTVTSPNGHIYNFCDTVHNSDPNSYSIEMSQEPEPGNLIRGVEVGHILNTEGYKNKSTIQEHIYNLIKNLIQMYGHKDDRTYEVR